MGKIKNLFSKWTSNRLLRLTLGIIIGIAYVSDGQLIYLLFSVFFLVQAVLNMGCGCANSGCPTPGENDKKTTYEFEKINTKKSDV